MDKKPLKATGKDAEKKEVFGNPVYSPQDDIYAHGKKEELENEDPAIPKGKALDVPGSELDDADELTGGEDEENNYYSLGGDEHNDLEEEKEE